MAKCVVCGKPATTQVTITENGKRRQLALCDEHYAQLNASRQQWRSPLESLFGGSIFDRMFGDTWPAFEDMGAGQRAPQSARRGRAREAVDLQSFLSESASGLLQQAAHKALDFGRTEVDTEHLLLALADNVVVQEILREF